MRKSLENIEFLIFDMGNVIIDIDISRTLKEFKNALAEDEFLQADRFMTSELHYNFETGAIGEEEFRNGIRSAFKREWEDHWIDTAWNTLLLNIPKERVDLLKSLRQNYKLYLLSNTNSIHFKVVEEIYKSEHGGSTFISLFDRVFLSYEMGLRKPDRRIYEQIVREIDAKPEQCLFFDDMEENLVSAKEVGLKTHHINHPKALTEFFADVQ